MAEIKLKNAALVAFGSTRRAGLKVEEDPGLRALLDCGASATAIVGKTWDFHVSNVLRCSLDDNIRLCADSVAYLKKQGLKVFFDAEHFFDGYKNNPSYAISVLKAAAEAGAEALVLCETNGGCLPEEVFDITKAVCRNWALDHRIIRITIRTVRSHARRPYGPAPASAGTINGIRTKRKRQFVRPLT